MSNEESYLFNDPDLIVASVVIPLDDMSFIVAFTSLNVQSFSAERFDIKSVWLSHEVSWDKLPIFVDLHVGLTANDSCTVALTDVWNLDSLVGLGAEDSVFVSTC